MDFVKNGGTLYVSYDGISLEGFDEVLELKRNILWCPKMRQYQCIVKNLELI